MNNYIKNGFSWYVTQRQKKKDLPDQTNSLNVYISAVSRTPIGGFNSSLASLQATTLGSIAIEYEVYE